MPETIFVYNPKEAAQTEFSFTLGEGNRRVFQSLPCRPALSLDKKSGTVFEFTRTVRDKDQLAPGDVIVARGEYYTDSPNGNGNVVRELHFPPLVHPVPLPSQAVEEIDTGQKDKHGFPIIKKVPHSYDNSVTGHAYSYFGVAVHQKLKIPLDSVDLQHKIDAAREQFRQKLAAKLAKTR